MLLTGEALAISSVIEDRERPFTDSLSLKIKSKIELAVGDCRKLCKWSLVTNNLEGIPSS